MKDLACRHSLWNIFSSLIEIMAISISNSVDKRNFEEREKRYLQEISNYNEKEIQLISKIFAEIILAMEEDPADILGTIYNEMQLHNKWTGQFFTPMQICKAMAGIILSDIESTIKKKGYITVLEPACGGGATIIGLAVEMRNKGINYQQKMLVHCVDIDYKAVAMTYIQLSLLGVSAVVVHGDSLSQKVYDTWYTPMYFINGWEQRLHLEKRLDEIKRIFNQISKAS